MKTLKIIFTKSESEIQMTDVQREDKILVLHLGDAFGYITWNAELMQYTGVCINGTYNNKSIHEVISWFGGNKEFHVLK